MNKLCLSLIVLMSAISITSCGGGSSSVTPTTNGDSTNNTDDQSSADNDANDGNSGSSGNDANNDSSENNNIDNNNATDIATTKVLLDRTKQYPTLGDTTIVRMKMTETRQNSSSLRVFNLWDYSYSPTRIDNTITFEGYTSNSLVSGEEFYQQLAREDIYEYSPRPIVESNNSRKLTTIRYDGGQSYLSGIVYDTKTALVFNNSTPPNLVDVKIKKEPELIFAGFQEASRDFCAKEEVSTGEIDFAIETSGFWQIGDTFSTTVNASGPIVSCDSNNNASIVGQQTDTRNNTVDTLTKHYDVFRLRGHDFNNVIEFTSKATTTTSSGVIFTESVTKTYLQYFVGEIAEVEFSCLGPINDPDAICNNLDEVATNVPTIPEI